MFDELLKTAIELRERERNERVEIGSINRAFMDVVYRYIPGWNHATHGFDLGKRNGVARTTMVRVPRSKIDYSIRIINHKFVIRKTIIITGGG
jgi:hypothetical protein